MIIIHRKSDNRIIDIIDAENVSGLAEGLAAVTMPGEIPATIPASLADIPGAAEAAAKRAALENALSGMIDALNAAYPELNLAITDTPADAGGKMIIAGVSWAEANNINTVHNAMK